MQKRVMFIAILLLAICNKIVGAGGTDLISISDFSLYSGGTKEVSVVMTNTDNYVGFQFDLVLPEGITVDSLSASERIPQGTSLQMAQQTDGSYRFIAYAQNRLPITGNDGAIMTLTLKASESVVPNSYTGYLRNVKMSTVDGSGVTKAEQPFAITVQGAEAYAVLSEGNTTLTFYYDKKKDERNGMSVGPFTGYTQRGWHSVRSSIIQVVFDDSFASYSPTSTALWFWGLQAMTSIEGIENLHTDQVTDMNGMFNYCYALEVLDLSNFNTANVTNIAGMFYGCNKLKSIFVGEGWSIDKIITTTISGTGGNGGWQVFSQCTSLVGGAGTAFDANHTDYTYAHIDGGASNPGYLTDIADNTAPAEVTFHRNMYELTLQCETPNVKMYYSIMLAGGVAVEDGQWQTYTQPITLWADCEVTAYAVRPSGIRSAIKEYVFSMSDVQTVDRPVFSWDRDMLSMSTPTEGASVYYTLSDDSLSAKLYEGPIEILRDVTITAIARMQGLNDSEPTTLDYPYTAWQGLVVAIDSAMSVSSQAATSDYVTADQRAQLDSLIAASYAAYSLRTDSLTTIKQRTDELMALTDAIRQLVNPVWSVIGTINGDWNTDTEMTSEDGVHYSASFPYLPAREYAFKIRANHDWTVNYGDGGVQDGPNVFANVSEDLSTVVVTFNADTKEIAYSVVAPIYSVIGSTANENGEPTSGWLNWSEDADMTKDENGIYSVTFDNMEAGNYQFKVRTNHDWTYNWGADGVQDGSNNSLTVSEAGPVTIYFDPVTHIAGTTYPLPVEHVATPTFSWNEDLLTISSETEGATITYKLEEGYYLVGGNGDWGNYKNQKMSQSSEEFIYTYVLQGFGTDLWFAFGDVAALNAIDNGNWNQLFGATNDGSELSGTYDRRYNLGGDHSFHVDGMAPYYRFTINTLDKTYLIEPLDSVPEFSASAENVYTYTNPVEIKRDVYITAVAKKEGMKDSEVANLDYPYTAWQDLRDAESKAQSVIYEYAGNEKVPQNMLDALKHLSDEAERMYVARTAERTDIEDMAARLRSMSEEIKQMAAPGINIYVAASEAPYLYAYDADNVSLNGDYFPGNVMSKKVTVNGEEFWTTKINHTGPFNINLVDSGYYRTREIYVISDRYFIYKGKDEYTDVTMKYFNAPEITISSIALPGNHNNWNRTKTFTEVEPGKKYTMDVDLTNVAIDDSLFTFKLYANACAWLGITSVTLEAPSYVRIIGDPALSADARNFYLDLNEAPTRKFTFEATWSGGYQMEEGWTLKITEATPTEQVETPSFSWLNDELSISTKTEGANIYYQLSDTDVNGDEVIDDADYALYSTALTIQRDVIIRAYAEKRGMLTSDTLVLEYPYRAWMDLKDMFNIARSMFSSAENTNKVPEDLLSEMLRQSYIAEDMFKERMAGRGDIEDQASILHHLINEVNSWLQVVASFENGLLTVQKATTLAEALNKCDANKVNESITTIVWASRQKLTDSDMQAISNPNVLIYVTDESMTSVTKNVVVGNDSIGFTAKNIVLTDVTNGNGDFKCTQAFTAERISYTREFKQQTQVDVCRGWETIALPFAVQTVTHERNGVIAPFGNSASGKHFWLRQLTQSGLQPATTIEANMPYLISMPNNTDLYAADFNQGGRVTFTAENTAVPVTTQHVTALADSTILFVPTTMQVGRSSDVWALNVGQVRGANLEGSVFERDFREVRPFEAYTVHRSNTPAPRFVPINDINGGNLTGISDAMRLNDKEQMINEKWYDLNGRQLQQKPTKGGVYILNGKKVVLR